MALFALGGSGRTIAIFFVAILATLMHGLLEGWGITGGLLVAVEAGSLRAIVVAFFAAVILGVSAVGEGDRGFAAGVAVQFDR